jgi:DNA gyrase/topoisomerase IV subunit B
MVLEFEISTDVPNPITLAWMIRDRPKFWLGDLSRVGLFEDFIFEALCHAIDEVIDGNCTKIEIKINSEDIQIDYDAGMSLESTITGTVRAEYFMTQIAACHNLKKHYEIGTKYCVYGLAILNNICSHFRVETVQQNRCWLQTYNEGQAELEFEILDCQSADRTKFIFSFDKVLLGEVVINIECLKNRINILTQEINVQISLVESVIH